jgi:hypothetical protein
MTAIRATFSQYAMVKTRGVLVLHMEVPLEQQADVFKVLGYPLPGEEVWCGIARLNPEGCPARSDGTTAERSPATPEDRRFLASDRGKARYASASDMERARTRAALLAKDARFRAWVAQQRWNASHDDDKASEDTAIKHIRDTCCAGESRKMIAEDEACYRAFIAMETQYLIETNQMAEPR